MSASLGPELPWLSAPSAEAKSCVGSEWSRKGSTRDERGGLLQVVGYQKPYYAGILQSPLTDSNRRPPPYQGTQGRTTQLQRVVARGDSPWKTNELHSCSGPRPTTRDAELRSHIGHRRLGSRRRDRPPACEALKAGPLLVWRAARPVVSKVDLLLTMRSETPRAPKRFAVGRQWLPIGLLGRFFGRVPVATVARGCARWAP